MWIFLLLSELAAEYQGEVLNFSICISSVAKGSLVCSGQQLPILEGWRENDFDTNTSLHFNFRACILSCPYFEMYLAQEDATKMSYVDLSFWMKVFLTEQLYICLNIHLISIQSFFYFACKMENTKLVISAPRTEDVFKLHTRSFRPKHLE